MSDIFDDFKKVLKKDLVPILVHYFKDSDNKISDNLNNFLVTEWDRLQNTNDTQDQFDDNEQHMIIQDAMNLLLDKLNVDSDDFEDHEQDVDWMKFDDIIGYYLCYV